MSETARKTCLVVDDDHVFRAVMRLMLEKLGFKVAEAVDGADALEYCYGVLPDVILLDWSMPVMDGLAFLEAFATTRPQIRPKIIISTADTDISLLEQAFSARANDYLLKPYDQAALEAKLRDVGAL